MIYVMLTGAVVTFSVYMPYALERKYPNAKFETKWQFLFPMKSVAKDTRYEVIQRHHVHEKTLGRNIKQASVKAQVHKRGQKFFTNYCIIRD